MAELFPVGSLGSAYCCRKAADCARRAEQAVRLEHQTAFRELERKWLDAAQTAEAVPEWALREIDSDRNAI
jgi:hypothetical protein